MPFPILGALLGGAQLIGAGIAARRNRVDTAAIEALEAENAALVDAFGSEYGGHYDDATGRATLGADMHANALGLNGADGSAAAAAAFRASPGYQWSVDQALEAMLRGASAGGMLASGNTLAAATELGRNLADQEFGGWTDDLAGYLGAEQQGLDDQAALGALISDARRGANDAVIARRSGTIADRRQTMQNLLGGARSIFSDMAGYGGFSS
ncbi:MAG: hypothetical protein IT534_02125 [Bauldia sp.]|nr:hypothetical protein [Bauldia sp.]